MTRDTELMVTICNVLTPQQRVVLANRVFDGMTHQEIADRYRTSRS